MPGVENIVPIMKPISLQVELKQVPTIVNVGDVQLVEIKLVMAGPCAIETKKPILILPKVKEAGADIQVVHLLRTSPYSFQGLEEDGLKIMAEAREITGLKLVTEVVDTRDVELVASYTDIIQIGARNMQNFRLLKEVDS